MRYAIIEDGVVTNVAVADKPFGENWVLAESANIGDLYDGTSFSPPPPPQGDVDKAWVALRAQRDALLVTSDWTQLLDTPLTDTQRQEWAVYRQALRDLPANTTDPLNPSWPEEPA